MTPDPRPKDPRPPVFLVLIAGHVHDYRDTRAAANELAARLIGQGRRDVVVEVRTP